MATDWDLIRETRDVCQGAPMDTNELANLRGLERASRSWDHHSTEVCWALTLARTDKLLHVTVLWFRLNGLNS